MIIKNADDVLVLTGKMLEIPLDNEGKCVYREAEQDDEQMIAELAKEISEFSGDDY